MFPPLDFAQLSTVLLKNRVNLPTCSAIYFALDETDRVLYIGQATNLCTRWQGQSHHRLAQLIRLDKKGPVRLAWVPCDPVWLTPMEDYYIALYNPLLNRTRVPEKRIIPAEVTLQKTLLKIAKYSIIFGMVPAQGKEPPVVNIRYMGWVREVSNIRRSLKAATKPPASLRWTETRPRKYGAWWRTKCNGVQIELGPWGSHDRDDLMIRATHRYLAGVSMPALPPYVLREVIEQHPVLGKNFPGIQALEADPIPMIWAKLR